MSTPESPNTQPYVETILTAVDRHRNFPPIHFSLRPVASPSTASTVISRPVPVLPATPPSSLPANDLRETPEDVDHRGLRLIAVLLYACC